MVTLIFLRGLCGYVLVNIFILSTQRKKQGAYLTSNHFHPTIKHLVHNAGHDYSYYPSMKENVAKRILIVPHFARDYKRDMHANQVSI